MNENIKLGANSGNAIMKKGGAPNNDGLPILTCLLGPVNGSIHLLVVDRDGRYSVGNNKYDTLSEAAESVTKTKTDGYTFWKDRDGNMAKDIIEKIHGKE